MSAQMDHSPATPAPSPAATASAQASGGDMDVLRSLIVSEERARLDALDARLGARAQFERAVAEVLPGALERAEEANGRALAGALAPALLRGLAERSRVAQADMVDALRPVAPDLARSARLAPFERMDERIAGWFGRGARACATEAFAPGRVERILLIERGSGLLAANWRRSGEAGEKADLIGGLIAAITAFARDALGERELRALDFGDKRVYLRMSGELIAAAQTDCALTPAQESALGERFVELLVRQRSGASVDDARLAAAAGAIDAARPRRRAAASLRLAQALGLCAFIALAALGWREGSRAATERSVHRAMEQFLAERPEANAFPLGAAFDHGQGRIELRLLASSPADAQALQAAAAAAAGPGYRIVTRLAQSRATIAHPIAADAPELAR
jgi:hypothetical protein